MDCFVCKEDLAENVEKCWLVEEAGDVLCADASVDPYPVCRSCATRMVGKRGALGREVLGFKVGANRPGTGGLILRK